jgi:hypothetical protein
LAKSSCGSSSLWLHEKFDQKTINSGRIKDMEMYPKLTYYEGEGKHKASAKGILM